MFIVYVPVVKRILTRKERLVQLEPLRAILSRVLFSISDEVTDDMSMMEGNGEIRD